MIELDVAAEQLIESLMRISDREQVCVLDSCGVKHLGSHLLIAGIRPIDVIEILSDDVDSILATLDKHLTGPSAAVFTLSYDFGVKLQRLKPSDEDDSHLEPHIFLALFNCLVVHDYDLGRTVLTGDPRRCDELSALLIGGDLDKPSPKPVSAQAQAHAKSSFTRSEYVRSVDTIREHIRAGDTYQTNLTQQIRCDLPADRSPQELFRRLRRDHPAPFAAYLTRSSSIVVSASPERFFRVDRDGTITASPIKGTRRRGKTVEEDMRMRRELLTSEKDRAENTMIVDLVRNDLGRVCEYGTVAVEKLCDLEEHPTLLHLVSTVRGKLRDGSKPSDILRALFPCGSITGAPKIRTMEIIEEIEPVERGLSMGAIGCYLPDSFLDAGDAVLDLSVAIRTLVIRESEITFNVGGGIVIDSDAEKEYEESLLKASALLKAIGADLDEPL